MEPRYEKYAIPFIYMERGHPKDGNDPANETDDNDTDYNGHTSSADGREDLPAYDIAERAVTDHENDVENRNELRRPVAHKIPRNDLLSYKRLLS